MAFTVIAKIKAKEGREAQVEAACRKAVENAVGETGTLSYVFHRSLDDPTVFVAYEVYQDHAAFDAHVSSMHFAELRKLLGPNIEGGIQADMLEELARK